MNKTDPDGLAGWEAFLAPYQDHEFWQGAYSALVAGMDYASTPRTGMAGIVAGNTALSRAVNTNRMQSSVATVNRWLGEEGQSVAAKIKGAVVIEARSAATHPDIAANRVASPSFQGGFSISKLDRLGKDARRASNLAASGLPTKPGFDRGEAHPAVLKDLVKSSAEYIRKGGGVNYEPSSQNKSDGGLLRHELAPYPDGTIILLKSR